MGPLFSLSHIRAPRQNTITEIYSKISVDEKIYEAESVVFDDDEHVVEREDESYERKMQMKKEEMKMMTKAMRNEGRSKLFNFGTRDYVTILSG